MDLSCILLRFLVNEFICHLKYSGQLISKVYK
nr:MAG TPA: hypothetical protein [Caudoviricetes sp.]